MLKYFAEVLSNHRTLHIEILRVNMPRATAFGGDINGEWCDIAFSNRRESSEAPVQSNGVQPAAVKLPSRPVGVFSSFKLKIRPKPETAAMNAACHGAEHLAYMVAVEHQRNIEKHKNENSEYLLPFYGGPLGLTIKESSEKENVVVFVEAIDPTGQAAKYKHKIKAGDRMVECGGVSIEGLSFDVVCDILRDSERPVDIKFQRPKVTGEKDPLNSYGAEAVHFLISIGNTAREPLKRRVLTLMDPIADRWQEEYEVTTSLYMDTEEGLVTVKDIFCFEHIGRSPKGKRQLDDYLRSSVGVTDATEWYKIDPGNSASMESLVTPAKGHTLLKNALFNSYFVECTDIHCPVGVTYLDFLKELPRVKPYRLPSQTKGEEDSNPVFEEQCSLLFAAIQTLSHFGDLTLSSKLLPDEFVFLHSSEVMEYGVQKENVSLVGQLVFCLRVFQVSDADPILKRGVQCLLNLQREDGSWGETLLKDRDGRDRDDQMFDGRFYRTFYASAALCSRRFRGFGPSRPGALKVLRGWLPKIGRSEHDFKRTQYATGNLSTNSNHLTPILEAYPKAADYRAQIKVSAKRRAELRLDKLLQFREKKKKMTPNQWKKYKVSGGYQSVRGLGLQSTVYAKQCKSAVKKIKSASSFLRKLEKFHRDINAPNVDQILGSIDFDDGTIDFSGHRLSLFDLYRRVCLQGGGGDHEDIWWANNARSMELPVGLAKAGNTLKRKYFKMLYAFEVQTTLLFFDNE